MPFSIEQFFEVFRAYNEAVYPVQALLILLAVVAVIATIRPGRYSGKLVSAVLAFLWLWMGVVYHLVYFTAINRAAWLFGAVFIVESIVFLYAGVFRDQLLFRMRPNAYGVAGGFFIAFALVLYPALGHLAGHVYPASPTFGAPCPTTIFTFGILLFASDRVPVLVYAVPFIWALIGATAALLLDVREDLGLLVAGVLGTWFIYLRK